MSVESLTPYLNITQACEHLRVDKRQLLSIIKSRGLRYFAFIDDKKPGLSNILPKDGSFTVFEIDANEKFTFDEATALCSMTKNQLLENGYHLERLQQPNEFLVTKNSRSIVIRYENANVIPIFTTEHTKETPIEHDGFVELCDDSFYKPDEGLPALFRGESCEIFQVKFDTPGHARHLSCFCHITLDDIYILATDISNMNQQSGSIKSLTQMRMEHNGNLQHKNIITLYRMICEDKPIRILLEKIRKPICLIELSWINDSTS